MSQLSQLVTLFLFRRFMSYFHLLHSTNLQDRSGSDYVYYHYPPAAAAATLYQWSVSSQTACNDNTSGHTFQSKTVQSVLIFKQSLKITIHFIQTVGSALAHKNISFSPYYVHLCLLFFG